MNKIVNRVAEAYDRLLRAVNEWVHEGVDHLEKRMKALMKSPKSGRFYGTHQASAPGEAPADHRHGLINSFDRDKKFLNDVLFSRNPVAIYMEEGTKDSEENQIIAPRPMWLATVNSESQYLKELLRNKLKKAQNDH